MEASVVRESITSFIVCQEGVIPCKTRGGKLLKTMELKKHVAAKGLTSPTVSAGIKCMHRDILATSVCSR